MALNFVKKYNVALTLEDAALTLAMIDYFRDLETRNPEEYSIMKERYKDTLEEMRKNIDGDEC